MLTCLITVYSVIYTHIILLRKIYEKNIFMFCIFAQSIVLQSNPFIELRHINRLIKLGDESTCDLNFKNISLSLRVKKYL